MKVRYSHLKSVSQSVRKNICRLYGIKCLYMASVGNYTLWVIENLSTNSV